jgi:cell division protein FtsB
MALTLLVATDVADTIGDWHKDSRRYTKLYAENQTLKAGVKRLKGERDLWKKACDNLDKELVDEAAKKSNLS